jgi:ABC-type dipeptide/oligopeptide/nickel transport system permease subunit
MGLTALGIICLIGITLYFSISFLGYGTRNQVEWGRDVNVGHNKLFFAPWASMWPGVAILFFEIPFILWIYGSWYAHVNLSRIKKGIVQEI